MSVKIATVVNETLLTVLFNKMDALTGAVVSQASPALPSVAFDVSSSAFAETGISGNRCLIALNSTMADAIYFRGTSSFTADNCEVHANSSNASALHLQGNANATASRFTTVGNWTQTGGAGSFSKTPEGNKASVSDPFNLSVTDPGGTAAVGDNKAKDGNVSLSATKYSDISLKAGGTATFTAGIHYITGTLSIAANSTVNANGVTLVLLGNSAKIDMGSGAVLKVQAPTTGTFAGFAVVGSSTATTVQVNTIQGGAATYLRGAWYTPKHKFYVTGNGDFNQNSEYFPIVADNIEFGGNGYAHIGFDASAYGYQQPSELHYQKPSSARLTN